MARPLPHSMRERILELHRQGIPKAEIARRLGFSRGTIFTLLKRCEEQGSDGLRPRYHLCGHSAPRSDQLLHRAYHCLRRWHPRWGYDKISGEVSAKYPHLILPHRRTVYRWWHAAGLIQRRSRPPHEPAHWAKELHEGWQIDAKEKMPLADQRRCCWLNIVDEHSGTVVDPPVFPQAGIDEVPVEQIQEELIERFQRWGIPRWIQVDNGRPFGDPSGQTISPLALWLIGLGIKVIWNQPRRPQQNAKVERCQGTLGRWTEYQLCPDHEVLQQRLRQQSTFYNEVFRDRRQEQTTRKERFPGLDFTGRPYQAAAFCLKRVLGFLAKGKWSRKVSTVGQLSHFGQRFSVGTHYRNQFVEVRIDPSTNEWVMSDQAGEPIKRQPTKMSAAALWKMSYHE